MLDQLELTAHDYDRLECYAGLRSKIKLVMKHKQQLIKQYKSDLQCVLRSNWTIGDEYVERAHPESLVIHYVDTEAFYNGLIDSMVKRDQSYRTWLTEHQYRPISDRDKAQAIKKIELTVPVEYRF